MKAYGQLENYIDTALASGRYYFSINEVKEALNISQSVLHRMLSPLLGQSKIALIRNGFYAIVPPEYRKSGAPPASYYIDGMMKGLNKPYYIGLLNAAAWYGAAHQQPQKYVVITKPPVLPAINKPHSRIDFVYKKEWQETDLVKKKTNAGYIAISSPELTALDLCYYPKHAGGINQVATVMEELADELDAEKIRDVSEHYNSIMAVQRLGFLLELIGNTELAAPMKEWLKKQKHFPALLDPSEKSDSRVTGNEWKIIVNTEIETDF